MRGCGDGGRGSNRRGKGLKRSGSYGRGQLLSTEAIADLSRVNPLLLSVATSFSISFECLATYSTLTS